MQEKFTNEQWLIISTAPSLIGSAVAMAGRSGVMGTMKEIIASGRSLAAGGEKYQHNPLIQSIIPKVEPDQTQAAANAFSNREQLMNQLRSEGIDSPEAMADYALRNLQKALAFLGEVVYQKDIDEYKQWVLETGQAVAEAAKEGGFLGIGGERVSQAETDFLARVRAVID